MCLWCVFDFHCSVGSDKKEFIVEVCHKVGKFQNCCNRLIIGLLIMIREMSSRSLAVLWRLSCITWMYWRCVWLVGWIQVIKKSADHSVLPTTNRKNNISFTEYF